MAPRPKEGSTGSALGLGGMAMGSAVGELFMLEDEISPAHAEVTSDAEATMALQLSAGERAPHRGKNEEQRRRSASEDLLEGAGDDLL